MRISTRGRYGLRAMVDLGLNAHEGPMPLRLVAGRQNLSESYLEQVFSSLRKAGLVTAVRGAHGGYEISRPLEEITVAEILEAVEGPISPVQCVDKEVAEPDCEQASNCPTRPFWIALRNHIEQFLQSVTLRDLVEQARQSKPDQPMYYI